MTEAARSAGSRGLEKYEVLEEIGHGGMATVYRARDNRLGREVAVKIIHKHLRSSAEVGARFVAEAKASAKLRHPNVVEVFDVSDEDDEDRFLVVELVRGTTLRKVLEAHRDMPAEVGAAFTVALCDALTHAHEAGVIHRDVKPENVLVDPKSRDGKVAIKLTDFGIAKMLDAQGVTSTGQVLGSPAHMAPEQIEAGEISPATDVFALGVLFYECLVGHLPFEGKNPAQVLRRVLDGVYPAADRERSTVGGCYARIVARALASEPRERWASAEALGDALRAELDALGVSDPSALLEAYFADSTACTAKLAAELPGRLVLRAELARRSGDVAAAASDYNRALALAPSDAAIFKRLTSLGAERARAAMARKLVVLGAGAVLLCGASYGVMRVLRHRASARPPAMVEPSMTTPSVEGAAPPRLEQPSATATAFVVASADPIRNFRLRFPVIPAPSSSVSTPTIRMALVTVSPKGASLTLDGRPIDAFGGKPIPLLVGPHAIHAEVPGSACCKPFSGTETVRPPPFDKPDEPALVLVRLEMNPTLVSLAGAPVGAQLLCAGVGISVGARGATSVTLKTPEWSGPCEFHADGATRGGNVKLFAGEPATVRWLAPE